VESNFLDFHKPKYTNLTLFYKSSINLSLNDSNLNIFTINRFIILLKKIIIYKFKILVYFSLIIDENKYYVKLQTFCLSLVRLD